MDVTQLLAANGGFSRGFLVFAAALVMITWLVAISRRRAKKQQYSPRAYAREQTARLREQQPLHDDLREVMMELENFAREINTQIETKYQKLEAVIRHADRRIAELKSLTGHQETPANPAQTDSGRSKLDVTVDDSSNPETEIPTHKPDATIQEAVYAMADTGESEVEISRHLDIPPGEVRLILSLRHEKAV